MSIRSRLRWYGTEKCRFSRAWRSLRCRRAGSRRGRSRFLGGGGPLGIALLPTAAQDAVELHERGEPLEARRREGVLRGEEQLLSLEDLEVVGEPGQIA